MTPLVQLVSRSHCLVDCHQCLPSPRRPCGLQGKWVCRFLKAANAAPFPPLQASGPTLVTRTFLKVEASSPLGFRLSTESTPSLAMSWRVPRPPGLVPKEWQNVLPVNVTSRPFHRFWRSSLSKKKSKKKCYGSVHSRRRRKKRGKKPRASLCETTCAAQLLMIVASTHETLCFHSTRVSNKW